MRPQPTPAQDDPDETTDIETLIREVVPEPDEWKRTPNPSLGGLRPEELVHSPQEQELRDLLRAAKHGVFS